MMARIFAIFMIMALFVGCGGTGNQQGPEENNESNEGTKPQPEVQATTLSWDSGNYDEANWD